MSIATDPSWNLFLKMGYSTKCYYCRLWDWKLVYITSTVQSKTSGKKITNGFNITGQYQKSIAHPDSQSYNGIESCFESCTELKLRDSAQCLRLQGKMMRLKVRPICCLFLAFWTKVELG